MSAQAERLPILSAVPDEEPAEGWSIQDLGTADWALARIADLEREMTENTTITNLQISKLQQRCQVLNAPLIRRVEFFRSVLATFAQTHRAALLGGGRKKSRALPHGVLGWKKTGGRLTVTDRDALLEWARNQPVELELVRVKEEPSLDEIKRHCSTTGEVPPGTEVSPESEELTIKAVMGGSDDGIE